MSTTTTTPEGREEAATIKVQIQYLSNLLHRVSPEAAKQCEEQAANLTMRQHRDLLAEKLTAIETAAKGTPAPAAAAPAAPASARPPAPAASPAPAKPAAPAADSSEGASAYRDYCAAMESGDGLTASQIWSQHEAAIIAYSERLDDTPAAPAEAEGDGATISTGAPAEAADNSAEARIFAEYQDLMAQGKGAAATRFWQANADALDRYAFKLDEARKDTERAAFEKRAEANGWGSFNRK